MAPADAVGGVDPEVAAVGDAADIVCEMVSIAEEQSAIVLLLQVGYLSSICVAVLARTLLRPVSMCAFVRVDLGVYDNLSPHTCLCSMHSAIVVGSMSRLSHPQVPVETQWNYCHLLLLEEV